MRVGIAAKRTFVIGRCGHKRWAPAPTHESLCLLKSGAWEQAKFIGINSGIDENYFPYRKEKGGRKRRIFFSG